MATIVFDFDGVLVKSRFSENGFYWSENIERELGVPMHVRNEVFEHKFWHPCIAGRGEIRSRVAEVLSKHGVTVSADAFIRYWLESDVNWYPATLDYLRDLKSRGNLLILGTNQDSNRGAFVKSLGPVRELFAEVISSGDLGYMKPDPEYFKLASVQIEMHADHKGPIYFIDDRKSNVTAANAHGWRAFHYDPDLSGMTLADLTEFLSGL